MLERFKVRVVIGDENSSTIAAVRKNNSEKIFKLTDKNYLIIKHFNNKLCNLPKKLNEIKKV